MVRHGTFCWYDLATTDVAGAETFYGSVIGWTAEDSGNPVMKYTVFQAGSVPVGGLMDMPPRMLENGGKPAWQGYVAVDDVDASAKQAASLGGNVNVEPTDIPEVGRFSVIADPHGATLVLFKRLVDVPVAPLRGMPGHGGWHELMAGDLDAAFSFYAAMFGWTKSTAVEMGAMGVYQLFAKDGVDIGGMMTKPAQMPGPPRWHYYIQVDGIRAAAERIGAAGGSVVNGPHPVPGGSWIVQGLDPQGAFFALVSPTE